MDARASIVIASILVMLAAVAHSQMESICNVPRYGVEACLPAAKPPNPPEPTAECCDLMKHADFCCLYKYWASPSLGIDLNLALQLPDKCHWQHPAPTQCA
ncbi:hypothetical protein CDL15_Pgr000387 [Punica granatum]|uniref:Bifunctional inhibitor/plant lipid transfer protein/seed storage helical domain-containing protein n=1 Tax=Punica granatum TaxID=22663 RepID=A0A218XSN2_PUNGR|nr:hypothetical protein CDL15_Pgr000380 [Punica granatum]OWM87964.1 hypothetical protein CDL15_Pgr000381 [Punica granatum]OWM87970.1 hypothetical protein CDL15_Pgr000387 [Punica granatum]PKH93962.1 hypothetical protein CRG98_049798 [Punica granatum]